MFQKNLVWEKNLWVGGVGGGGSITSSVEFLLAHSVDKFRRGTLLCFKRFLVWQKFRDMRGVSRFSVEFFCLTLSERIAGEPFCVSKKFWYRRFSSRRVWGSGLGLGGGYHGFVENFLSYSAEKLRVENFW